jgi:lipopolysaccharide/colanic/teichoic acid biosynthesis glycosyltransferase
LAPSWHRFVRLDHDADGISTRPIGDPRKTRRSLKLDDKFAPQLKNFSIRLTARPGLSGLAQINGARGETPTIHHMKRRLDFDIQYIKNASPFLDLKIVVQTALIMFFSRDAY